ncbi:MAG: caspase family protein [Bacteroidia bacterium]|nr:caspase family protein [Bacteroidia bacterium]
MILASFATASAQSKLVLQKGHAGDVVYSTYSPSGKYLYTIGEDGGVLSWELNSSRQMEPLYGMLGHEQAIKLYFANKTEFLVLTNGNNFYLGKEGSSELKPYSGYSYKLNKTEACKTSTGTFFIAAAQYKTAKQDLVFYFPLNKRDTRTQFLVGTKDIIEGEIKVMHFEPENHNLFIGDDQGNLYCVDADSRAIKLIRKFKKTEISKLHSTAKNMVLETRSLKGNKRVLYWLDWNQASKKTSKPVIMSEDSKVQSISYIPWREEYAIVEKKGDSYVPAMGFSGSAGAFKVKYFLWEGEHNKPVLHMTLSGDGRFLALFPFNGEYLIYNTYENTVVQRLHKPALEFSDFEWDAHKKIMYTFSSSKRLCTKIDLERDIFSTYTIPIKRESTHHFMQNGQFVFTDNFSKMLYSFKPNGQGDSIESPFSMYWEFHANRKSGQILGYGKNKNFIALDANTLKTQFEVPFNMSTMMGQFGYSGDNKSFWFYNTDFDKGDTVLIHSASTGAKVLKFVKEDLVDDSFGIELNFDFIEKENLLLVSTSELKLDLESKIYRLLILDPSQNYKVIKVINIEGEVKKFFAGRKEGEIGLHLKNYKGEYTVGFFHIPDFSVEILDVNLGEKIENLQWEGDRRFWMYSNVQTHIYKGQSGELKLFNLDSGTVDYDLINNDKGYALVSKNQGMLCTKGSSDLVAFQSVYDGEPRLVPGGEFEAEFNKPHHILSDLDCTNKSIIGAYAQAYDKRMTRLGQSKISTQTGIPLPSCKVGMIDGTLVTGSAIQSLKVKYESGVPIRALYVEQNGCPNGGPAGYRIHPDSALSGVYGLKVTMVPGINRLSFYVVDTMGRQSIPDYKEVNLVDFYVTPRTYYIGIGVSNYKDSNYNLHYAAKDIRDMCNWVAKWPNSIVDTFINEKSLWDSIGRVRNMLKSLNPWDKVIVSFSGHGMLAKDLEFYIALNDMDFSHPEKNGLKLDSLLALLDQTSALQKLVLLDACHSGEIDKEGKVISVTDSLAKDARGYNIVVNKKPQRIDAFEFMKSHFEDAASANGVVVISAAGGEEYALESRDWENGVFTYALLNCLFNKTGDLDKNSKISISELKNYLMTVVPELTNNQQRPTMRKENPSNDWEF